MLKDRALLLWLLLQCPLLTRKPISPTNLLHQSATPVWSPATHKPLVLEKLNRGEAKGGSVCFEGIVGEPSSSPRQLFAGKIPLWWPRGGTLPLQAGDSPSLRTLRGSTFPASFYIIRSSVTFTLVLLNRARMLDSLNLLQVHFMSGRMLTSSSICVRAYAWHHGPKRLLCTL